MSVVVKLLSGGQLKSMGLSLSSETNGLKDRMEGPGTSLHLLLGGRLPLGVPFVRSHGRRKWGGRGTRFKIRQPGRTSP